MRNGSEKRDGSFYAMVLTKAFVSGNLAVFDHHVLKKRMYLFYKDFMHEALD